MRRVGTVAAAAVVLGGCGGGERREPAATTPAEVIRTAEPTATAAPLPPHRTVRFRTPDGVRLEGSFTPAGKDAPALVLVHEYNGEPAQFDPLVPVLHDAGFATLAYGSRDPRELDEAILARDVRGAVAAVRRQPSVDAGRVGLVGSSIGGTTVSYVLGTSPALKLRGGVGLSPVENGGLITAAGNGRFHPHDLLLIADDHEFGDVENIRMDADGKGVTGFKARIGGHGVRLLPDAQVRERLVAWLEQKVAG